MRVTLSVVGGDSHEFDVDGETYADLLGRLDISPHEVAVVVDGRPVPGDSTVEAEEARVVRLVSGG